MGPLPTTRQAAARRAAFAPDGPQQPCCMRRRCGVAETCHPGRMCAPACAKNAQPAPALDARANACSSNSDAAGVVALTSSGSRRKCSDAIGRRGALLQLMSASALCSLGVPNGAARASDVSLSVLQEEAYLAYGNRRFQEAVNIITTIIEQEPSVPRWYEMRAQALVDGKNFGAAMADFDQALRLLSGGDPITRARLLSGRALAEEGASNWERALQDYTDAQRLASEGGESVDPYIVNSIGNCLNSLGRWSEAREQYLISSEIFQASRGFRGRDGSTTPRLDGAVFAASNAALMLAQLGDTQGAVSEMVRIARRAPGSADMRAALAALYWSEGERQRAEEQWEFACDRITVGCVKYRDLAWLRTVRRWPPAMVERMKGFLALQ